MASRWSEQEDKQLTELLKAGNSAYVIARCMGRCESSVNRRIEHLATPMKYSDRDCLCCGKTFRSQGPHNRLCNYCRRIETTPFHG